MQATSSPTSTPQLASQRSSLQPYHIARATTLQSSRHGRKAPWGTHMHTEYVEHMLQGTQEGFTFSLTTRSMSDIHQYISTKYHGWCVRCWGFMEVANHHAPLKMRKCRERMVPWMTSEIRELMCQRDKTHRIAVEERSEQHFRLYKSMRNHVDCELRRARTPRASEEHPPMICH